MGGWQPEKSRNVGRGVPLIWQPCCSTRPPDLSSLPLREILAYVRIPRLTFELHMPQYKSPSLEYRIVPPSFFLLFLLRSLGFLVFFHLLLLPFCFSLPRDLSTSTRCHSCSSTLYCFYQRAPLDLYIYMLSVPLCSARRAENLQEREKKRKREVNPLLRPPSFSHTGWVEEYYRRE